MGILICPMTLRRPYALLDLIDAVFRHMLLRSNEGSSRTLQEKIGSLMGWGSSYIRYVEDCGF